MSNPLDDLFAHNAGARRLRSSHLTPSGRVRLRDVRPADAAAVHGLLLHAVEEGLGFVATPDELGTDPTPTRRALAAVEAGDGLGVVAEHDGVVVGYAIARSPGPSRLAHDGHLEIVLVPSMRGAGLGGALLDALVDRARNASWMVRLSLAVFADNTPAVRLYRSRGFLEEGRRRAAVRGDDGTLRDDLLMVLFVQE